MAKDDRDDSTQSLIAEGEALRAKEAVSKKPPRTKHLVRDAERLIGRTPAVPPETRRLLRWAVIMAVVALALAAVFLLV
jgi:hypothetical protein